MRYTPRFAPILNGFGKKRIVLLGSILLGGCGGDSPLQPPIRVPIELTTVRTSPGMCEGAWCGYRIILRVTHRESNEPVATTLRAGGDGRWSPATPRSLLPDGIAEVYWEFPNMDGSYALSICPETETGDACESFTVSVSR